jgi:hypothetical protein
VPQVELTGHLLDLLPALRAAVGAQAAQGAPADRSGRRELSVEASTVAEVVAEIEKLAPGFAFYVCDERGALRTHVNVFVDSERINDRKRLSDRVEPGQRVYVMQALSGG